MVHGIVTLSLCMSFEGG